MGQRTSLWGGSAGTAPKGKAQTPQAGAAAPLCSRSTPRELCPVLGVRVPWRRPAGAPLLSPKPRAWGAGFQKEQQHSQRHGNEREAGFNLCFIPSCESPSSAPSLLHSSCSSCPEMPGAAKAGASQGRLLPVPFPSRAGKSSQGHRQEMGSRGDPEGSQRVGLPASLMDGEGPRETPGTVQAMDIRQGRVFGVPSAGHGMWGHREGQDFGAPAHPVPSSWAGSKGRFPSRTLRREGMSKTSGILGKLTQCFLSLPAILRCF